MSDVIKVNRFECLARQIEWNDQGGPIDFTGRTLSIVEAYPAALKEGTLTATETPGRARLFIAGEHMAKAGAGRVNWLRLGHGFPGGCMDTTPRIYVEVV